MKAWNTLVSGAGALVFATAFLAGCGGSGTSSGGGGNNNPPAVGATSLFVVNNNTQPDAVTVVGTASDTIVKLNASASGSSTPLVTITGPVGYKFSAMAIDASGNLYVGATSVAAGSLPNPEVLVYASTTSTATPARTIGGANTGLGQIQSIAVDSSGQVYVSCGDAAHGNTPSVLVFAANANGNVAPIRAIADTTTPAGGAYGVGVDGSGNVYLSEISPNRIAVFAASANGTVTPIRTFTPSVGGGSGAFFVDSAGTVYTVASVGGSSNAEIAVYTAGSSGSVTPARTIGGSKMGANTSFRGLSVDAAGTMYASLASEPVFPTTTYSVLTFNSSASGDVNPTTQITGSAVVAAGAVAVH